MRSTSLKSATCWLIAVALPMLPMLASCGGPATKAPAQEPPTLQEQAPPTPPITDSKKPVADEVPDSALKSCTVNDSNGPEEGGDKEGGDMTTRGCAEDEFCMCRSRAGYSCAGVCKPRSSAASVGVSAE